MPLATTKQHSSLVLTGRNGMKRLAAGCQPMQRPGGRACRPTNMMTLGCPFFRSVSFFSSTPLSRMLVTSSATAFSIILRLFSPAPWHAQHYQAQPCQGPAHSTWFARQPPVVQTCHTTTSL